MAQFSKNRIYKNIFLLIFSAGILFFPAVILADDFQNIASPKEAAEYLELSEKNTEDLIHSLIKVFYSEWENMMTSSRSDEEEMAVPIIMREAVKSKSLSYLLMDAPLEIFWGTIKGALKISRIFLAKDISGILEEFEKESVDKAINYGMNILIQNEIRTTSGAIEFGYTSKNKEKISAVVQYLVIYKPIDKKTGNFKINFYSPNFLSAPRNEGSIGMFSGMYTELTSDLPPFIVSVQGEVEDFNLVRKPEMDIDFSPEVPDFGLKPSTLLERQIIKPVESTIKEAEVIITKVTGKSPGITDIWEKIKSGAKSFLSEINSFSPAALVEIPQINTYPAQTSYVVDSVNNEEKLKEIAKDNPQQLIKQSDIQGKPLSLSDIQEQLDDITEEIDVLTQEIFALDSVNHKEKFKEIDNKKLPEENENDGKEDNTRDEKREIDDEAIVEDSPQQPNLENQEITLCEKTGIPAKNKVIFNEIAWMGGEKSANDEWIELKNISEQEISLTGWQILDSNNEIRIVFNEKMPLIKSGLFLLERTNDDSILGITADLIYTGGLNNENEILYLFDENCQLQDIITALPKWEAGDNNSKRTTERKSDLTWQTSENIRGTPKAENSKGYVVVFNYGSPSTPPTETVEDNLQQTICSKNNDTIIYSPIILNEIAWMGSASNSADEWIELKNISTSTIPLNNWQLLGINSENNENKITVVFDENDSMEPSSYFLLERTDDETIPDIAADKLFTGSINNSSFILRLFNDECALIDETTATSTWLAGQKEPEKKTMERIINLEWQTSYSSSSVNGLFGTPRTENSQQKEEALIEENQIPIALFNYQPENPIINQEIIFDASSSTDSDGTITSYIWNFGDGNSTTTEVSTTTYSYATSSEFLLSLQVLDDTEATSSLSITTISVSAIEEPTLEIVINEIAWMGTSATNSEDEWLELYNNTDSDVDLTGWKILKNGEDFIEISTSTVKEMTTSIISAQSFYLFERTDDTTVSDILADLIYTGPIGNDGEKLELRDNNGSLIDVVDCPTGWFAGTTTSTYVSMERINTSDAGNNPGNWENNNLISRNGKDAINHFINGTPKSENSVSKTETNVSDLPFNEFNEITLTHLGNPYIIVNSLTIPEEKTLIIEPDVTLKFKIPDVYGPGDGAYLKVQGKLRAMGEIEKEIIFTSTADRWPGIIFENETSETEISSQLEYVKIEKAKSWEPPAFPAIKINKKAISIKNSILDANLNYRGIFLVESFSIIDNVTFNNFNGSPHPSTGEYPSAIFIDGGAPIIKNCYFPTASYGVTIQTIESCYNNSNFKISSNNFDQNQIPIYIKYAGVPCFEKNLIINPQKDKFYNIIDGVVFAGATINEDSLWQTDIPFIVEKSFSIENATLTISSNTTIKFRYNNDTRHRTFLELKNGATLITKSEIETNIIFTSARENPLPGDWEALYFREGSFGILENVIINYGGFGKNLNDCLKIESDNVSLINVDKYQCSPY